MVVTASSAIFIQGSRGPRFHGYSLIHLLIPIVFAALFGAFWYLARRDVAGGFTLLPSRYLGDLLWLQWLQLA